MFGVDNQPKYIEGFMDVLLGNLPYKGNDAVRYTHPTVHYNTF